MRTSTFAAALLSGFGIAALATPAAAVPAGPSIAVAAPADTIVNVRMKKRRMKRVSGRRMMGGPSTSGGRSTATPGAPAGSTGGNGVTGSGAAPTGK